MADVDAKVRYTVSREDLETAIKHIKRRVATRRGWSLRHQTKPLNDTLQALLELHEARYGK